MGPLSLFLNLYFSVENSKDVVRNLKVEVNKSMRAKSFVASKYEKELEEEIDFFNTQVKCDAEVSACIMKIINKLYKKTKANFVHIRHA